jgi:FixJ family two-component response regulator
MGALEKMQHKAQIVYVVDDERVIAETLATILCCSGFAAKGFQDPQDVLEFAGQSAPPDLLIADVMMPGMTGIDLAIRMRETYPECRVLLFSGKADTADLLETARRQGYDFELLSKPVYPADLLARIESQMRNDEEEQRDVPTALD